MLHEAILLSALGFGVGTIGTMVGAGGGFILVPALLILYPAMDSETVTGVSLVIVFCNAFSGSIAYAYKKCIDYRSAIIFSLAAAPGSVLGAYATSLMPRRAFEYTFGFVMVFISLYLIFNKKRKALSPSEAAKKYPVRTIIDRNGKVHLVSYSTPLGVSLSGGVGFLSSLLGIGGGIIHVPIMVKLLNFPVHVATATSHLVLAASALIGASIHLFSGHLATSYHQLVWLAPMVIIGAQLGAYLSSKINESWIIRVLALGLLSVGLRFILL